jgi:hypothetical protein
LTSPRPQSCRWTPKDALEEEEWAHGSDSVINILSFCLSALLSTNKFMSEQLDNSNISIKKTAIPNFLDVPPSLSTQSKNIRNMSAGEGGAKKMIAGKKNSLQVWTENP